MGYGAMVEMILPGENRNTVKKACPSATLSAWGRTRISLLFRTFKCREHVVNVNIAHHVISDLKERVVWISVTVGRFRHEQM